MTQNTNQPTQTPKQGVDWILIVALVVAVLNFAGIISNFFSFNLFGLILAILNTLAWVVIGLVRLRQSR